MVLCKINRVINPAYLMLKCGASPSACFCCSFSCDLEMAPPLPSVWGSFVYQELPVGGHSGISLFLDIQGFCYLICMKSTLWYTAAEDPHLRHCRTLEASCGTPAPALKHLGSCPLLTKNRHCTQGIWERWEKS